jgi:hypothetical protein
LEPEKNRTDEIRSEAVQEILSFVPHWIIRWGITVILFTVAVILAVSWFMSYPDIIPTRITLTTKNVMNIVPTSQEITGTVRIPVHSFDKVKCGQKVNIKFDNYPYTQYGVVNGKVISISEVPKDNYYSAEVSITGGLVTNYKKNIFFEQGMQGDAEIITDDRRLLERIFARFRTLKEEDTK